MRSCSFRTTYLQLMLACLGSCVFGGGVLLESFDISKGKDPEGGSSFYYAPGEQAFFAQIHPQLTYLEGSGPYGGESLVVAPSGILDKRFLNVLRYNVNPSVARSEQGDGFLNALAAFPLFRFDAERIGGGGGPDDFSTTELVLETDASTGDLSLAGIDLRQNDAGPQTLTVNLGAHQGFQQALEELLNPNSAVTKFRLNVRQQNARTIPFEQSTIWRYDNFALGSDLNMGTYRLSYFPPALRVDPRVSGPAVDPDGDGLANLFEYLNGSDPLVADTATPGEVDTAPSLTLQFDATGDPSVLAYRHQATAIDAALAPETSTDLLEWSSVEPEAIQLFDDGTVRHWQLQLPASNPPADKAFFRLRARSISTPATFTDTIPGVWTYSSPALPPLADILARPTHSVAVYGLYCWANEYLTYRDFVRAQGWRHFRLSGPVSDAVMRAYSEDGVEVMFTLGPIRPFVSEAFPNGERHHRGDFSTDADFIAAYLGDLQAVIDRYGSNGSFWSANPDLTHRPLRAIEIFNEPNFWYLNLNSVEEDSPAAQMQRIETYAQLLPAAAARIRTADPSIQVVGFAAGGSAGADIPFIRDVHSRNPAVAASYDVISTHPYVLPVPTEAVNVRPWGTYSIVGGYNGIRDIQADWGSSAKPIWWSELNWSITDGHYADGPETDLYQRTVDPRLQAAYLVRAHALALRLGVDRLTIMSLVDTDGVNSGLLERNGKRRPSAESLAVMMALMPHPKLAAVPMDGQDGIFVYEIQPDVASPLHPPVIMAWSMTRQNTPTQIPYPQPSAWLCDMEGRHLALIASQDGYIDIQLGPEPIYIFQSDATSQIGSF